jgi:hypothetical protein
LSTYFSPLKFASKGLSTYLESLSHPYSSLAL